MSLDKEKYRLLVENLPLGFAYLQLVVDRDGTPCDAIYLDVNPAFEKLTGLSREAVIGNKVTEIFHEYKVSKYEWIEKCGKLAQSGGSLQFEHFIESMQSWYKETIFTDEPGFFTVIFSDITGEETNHNLLEERERFEQLFRHNPTLMALTTLPERRYHDVNNAFLETLGYTRQEVIGKTSAELGLFVYPEDSKKAAELLKEKGQIENFETKIRRRDGTIIEGVFSSQIYSSRGKQYFLTSMLDLTARKKAEKKVDAAHEQMLTILNTIDAHVYVTDIETHEILYTNRHGRNLWGEIVGKKCWQVFHNKTSEPCENCTIDQVLAEGDQPGSVYRWETKNSLNGHWYDCRETIMTWHDGRTVCLEIATDITEMKQREEKILYVSFHDKMTGLYNRSYLEEEMNRLDTPRQLPISIIMADLNGLKLINDTLGHAAGDEMLKAAAEILKKSCREEDIIARWGGDEFIIFLPQTNYKTTKAICKKINELSRRTYSSGMPVSIAVGAATKTTPEQTLPDLLSIAENNMYKQKFTYGHSTKSFVLETLLKILQEKSKEAENHTSFMHMVAGYIGKKLGLSEPELSRLDLLITLHDIGKVTLSEDILNKEQPLSAAEMEMIKAHPATGYRIAKATEGLSQVAEEILAHHEHWDGSGYPQGLKGRLIPLLARITAIAEACEVMINGRPYKKALPKEEVIAELKQCSGKQFDPELTEIMIKAMQEEKVPQNI